MKRIFMVVALLLAMLPMVVSNTANAAVIMSAGDFQFIGQAYIDTSKNTINGTGTRGVGRITSILDAAGDIAWSYGADNTYLAFVFDGIHSNKDLVTNDFIALGSDGGTVKFYESATNNFDSGLNFTDSATTIGTGELWLDAIIAGLIAGHSDDVSYRANGFIDVVGGSQGTRFDTGSRSMGDGNFADLSFSLVGSNNDSTLVHADYEYRTSAFSDGNVSTVPTPSALLLLGSGMVGLIATRRKPTV